MLRLKKHIIITGNSVDASNQYETRLSWHLPDPIVLFGNLEQLGINLCSTRSAKLMPRRDYARTFFTNDSGCLSHASTT